MKRSLEVVEMPFICSGVERCVSQSGVGNEAEQDLIRVQPWPWEGAGMCLKHGFDVETGSGFEY